MGRDLQIAKVPTAPQGDQSLPRTWYALMQVTMRAGNDAGGRQQFDAPQTCCVPN